VPFLSFICAFEFQTFSKAMWDTEKFNIYSSNFTENFKGIELKAQLILNVNCVKTLQYKFDFIACVKSLKKELSNDV